MARSLKKGPFVDYKLLKKIKLCILENKKKFIKTWSRKSTIIPIMIGFTICVHNGKQHIPIVITDKMIGYKLGMFSPTRVFKKHSSSKIKHKRK